MTVVMIVHGKAHVRAGCTAWFIVVFIVVVHDVIVFFLTAFTDRCSRRTTLLSGRGSELKIIHIHHSRPKPIDIYIHRMTWTNQME